MCVEDENKDPKGPKGHGKALLIDPRFETSAFGLPTWRVALSFSREGNDLLDKLIPVCEELCRSLWFPHNRVSPIKVQKPGCVCVCV